MCLTGTEDKREDNSKDVALRSSNRARVSDRRVEGVPLFILKTPDMRGRKSDTAPPAHQHPVNLRGCSLQRNLPGGLRLGEALSLAWMEVKLEPANKAGFGCLTVLSGKAKNRRSRNVPLSERAVAMLRR